MFFSSISEQIFQMVLNFVFNLVTTVTNQGQERVGYSCTSVPGCQNLGRYSLMLLQWDGAVPRQGSLTRHMRVAVG